MVSKRQLPLARYRASRSVVRKRLPNGNFRLFPRRKNHRPHSTFNRPPFVHFLGVPAPPRAKLLALSTATPPEGRHDTAHRVLKPFLAAQPALAAIAVDFLRVGMSQLSNR